MSLKRYTFTEHLHNYAVWTAARAAQRGFTTTQNIKQAIEETQLQELAEGKLNINTIEAYDEFHKKTCNKLIEAFQKMELKKDIKAKATFGRAAKIVAIYLKTAVVIRDSGKSQLSKIIHPPIDRILLTKLNKNHKQIKVENWTQLSKDEYDTLWEEIKALPIHKNGYWEIEVFWNV
jgi:hypothetical protein